MSARRHVVGTLFAATVLVLWTASPALAVPDTLETDDQFGSSTATGDFNGDGVGDMAVGVPLEDVGGAVDAGAVSVVYGSPAGLVAAGSQLWHQDSGAVLDDAEEFDNFGSSLAAADFNRDGHADLAIGVLNEDVLARNGLQAGDAGAVTVLYGSPAGLTDAGNQLFHQDVGTVLDDVEIGDRFGTALAAGDFGGSSHPDLAVGVAHEQLGANLFQAGAVNVLYGTAAGLGDAGNQFWHQDSPDIPDVPETSDTFGLALAAADFGRGKNADLAVEVFNESIDTTASAGAVHVIYGSSTGLTSVGTQLWHQNSPGVPDAVEPFDHFGFSLTGANLGRGQQADLVIGVPFEDLGTITDAGVAHVLYGSAQGVTTGGNQLWHQDSPGVVDTAEPGDLFGWALASADLGKSSYADLAVGVVRQNGPGGFVDSGAVNVLYGTSQGLSSSGNQLWDQTPAAIPDDVEFEDLFGAALAAGNVGLDRRADLVVGVPLEDVGAVVNPGAVNVLYGTGNGLTDAGAQIWHQDP